MRPWRLCGSRCFLHRAPAERNAGMAIEMPEETCRGAAMRAPCLGERRSEEHTSELQSLMRISYAVFCLKKKINITLAALSSLIITPHNHMNIIHTTKMHGSI